MLHLEVFNLLFSCLFFVKVLPIKRGITNHVGLIVTVEITCSMMIIIFPGSSCFAQIDFYYSNEEYVNTLYLKNGLL